MSIFLQHHSEEGDATGYTHVEGLTLRDLFAMAALAGTLANPDAAGNDEDFARWSYERADAMLAAREGKK